MLAFVLTLLVNAAIGFVMFAVLLVGMNGFPSAKSAEPGIILFTVWAIVSALIMSFLSALAVYFLEDRKKINSWLASGIAVSVFSAAGGISVVIGWTAGRAFASYLFTNR